VQEGGGWPAALWIHAHVQRSLELHRKAPRRVVNLHGGNSQVSQDEVGPGQPSLGEGLRQPSEVGAMRDKDFRTEPKRVEPGFRSGQLNRVGVQAEQLSTGLDARENLPGVRSVTMPTLKELVTSPELAISLSSLISAVSLPAVS